jgi:hypothetical protein
MQYGESSCAETLQFAELGDKERARSDDYSVEKLAAIIHPISQKQATLRPVTVTTRIDLGGFALRVLRHPRTDFGSYPMFNSDGLDMDRL